MNTASVTARITAPTARRHATEAEYSAWVKAFIPHYAARYERMASYRRFVQAWPDLEEWFQAPLLVRAGFTGGPLRANGRTATFDASGYLVYLALVRGVGLGYEFLFVRKYARLFSVQAGGKGLGVDLDLFESHVTKLDELGYIPESARSNLTWAIGRLLLHRGDPDITAITAGDLFAMAEQIRAFGQREDFAQLRAALYQKSPWQMTGENAGERFTKAHLAKVHCLHVLLFNIGQVTSPPTSGTRRRKGWEENLLPEPCPPRIRAVVERYLSTRLEAQLDRPQTVRIAREGLRRFVNWLGREHPEVISLAQLDRTLVEEYLRWLPTYTSQTTGQPLQVTTRKHEINAIGAFCRDTSMWGWDDVPGGPLLTTRDAPRRLETVPRYLPRHELDSLMAAIEGLTDPLQRTALLLLRWSGARRDEIRRLTWDCLDAYASGHPRLRIPVGKGHSERLIPLHPDAALSLQEAINQAKAMKAVARRDATTGRLENYIFVRKGKLLSSATLFDDAFEKACTAAGLVDSKGTRTVSAHRLRHTLGTQLAEGGARIQTIMTILGHKSASMSMIYSRISDPVVRRQYEEALASGNRIAGPAAEALITGKLDDESIHWLQTNFLKTELELGHCLRLPAEGPCECELMLTCPKFLTTTEYAPRLRARLERQEELIADAEVRGWPREVERHRAAQERIRALLQDLA
ncbi:site-specific integrase [Arthrobacter sp. DNA4]|uniref:tyrosine-type recombinase/integrase n=1 Tax=Arthrobacter sp. DNA4 TaxID=2963432 RepID=UPI0020CD1561|nr:tyrosine-type recombinase/integrase [Arthrobacter sp. DNA4]UTT69369.1 site-specific integrase [Arthrobacter sp. DNA4]